MIIVDNIIVGAGIAGACVAWHLKQKGESVYVLDSAGIGQGASGNIAAALYPLFTAEPSKMGSFYVAAYDYALKFYGDLLQRIPVICCPTKGKDESRFRRIAAQQEFASYAKYENENLVYPQGGILEPHKVLPALLKDIPIIKCKVSQWQKTIEGYQIGEYNCKKLYICNGWQASQLLPELFIIPVRGQITVFKTACQFQHVKSHNGYAISLKNNLGIAGSTYQRHSTDKSVQDEDNQQNLQRWQKMTNDYTAVIQGGRASIRGSSKDTLPYYHEIAENLYVLTALGSRGFTTAPYCARQITLL